MFVVSTLYRQSIKMPHPKLTEDTTNESQEVSPFLAGDHKAHINRRAQRHSQHKTEQKHKRSTKEVPPWNFCKKIFFFEPNSFMLMFNVSTLYRQSIELFLQKL